MKHYQWIFCSFICVTSTLFSNGINARHKRQGFVMSSKCTNSSWNIPEFVTSYGSENCFQVSISNKSSASNNDCILSWLTKKNTKNQSTFRFNARLSSVQNIQNHSLPTLPFPCNTSEIHLAKDVDSNTAFVIFEKTEEIDGVVINSLMYSWVDTKDEKGSWSEPTPIIQDSDDFLLGGEFSISNTSGTITLAYTGLNSLEQQKLGLFYKEFSVSSQTWSDAKKIYEGQIFQPKIISKKDCTIIICEEDVLDKTNTHVFVKKDLSFTKIDKPLFHNSGTHESIPNSPTQITFFGKNALAVWVKNDHSSKKKRLQSALINIESKIPFIQELKSDLGEFLSNQDVDANFVEISSDEYGNAIAVWNSLYKDRSQQIHAAIISEQKLQWESIPIFSNRAKTGPFFFRDLAYPTVTCNSKGDTLLAWSWFNGQKNVIQTIQSNIHLGKDLFANCQIKEISNSHFQSFDPQISIDDEGRSCVAWLSQDVYPPSGARIQKSKKLNNKTICWNKITKKTIKTVNLYKNDDLIAHTTAKNSSFENIEIDDEAQYSLSTVDHLGNESIKTSIE